MNDFLAHEVRNPLSVAVSGLRFVENALSSSATPEVIADLNMVRANPNINLNSDCGPNYSESYL